MKITVFGGCCSADTFYSEPGKSAGMMMFGYFARSSLVSAYSKKISADENLDLGVVSSDFQRKMLELDINKTLLENIFLSIPDDGWLMMDFLVERLALAETTSGSFLTMSSEARLLFKLNEFSSYQVIPASSERKKQLFKVAWNKFYANCLDKGVADKLIIILSCV